MYDSFGSAWIVNMMSIDDIRLNFNFSNLEVAYSLSNADKASDYGTAGNESILEDLIAQSLNSCRHPLHDIAPIAHQGKILKTFQ